MRWIHVLLVAVTWQCSWRCIWTLNETLEKASCSPSTVLLASRSSTSFARCFTARCRRLQSLAETACSSNWTLLELLTTSSGLHKLKNSWSVLYFFTSVSLLSLLATTPNVMCKFALKPTFATSLMLLNCCCCCCCMWTSTAVKTASVNNWHYSHLLQIPLAF